MSLCIVDLSKLENNFCVLKDKAHGAKIFCVVKSNAYGCGLTKIASVLNKIGADGFVVADFAEGEKLRQIGISSQILILGYTPPALVRELMELNLTQSVFNGEYLARLSDELKNRTDNPKNKLSVCIKFNCGFNRLGFCDTQQLTMFFDDNHINKHIEVTGIFSHLSCSGAKKGNAYKINNKQILCFDKIVKKFEFSFGFDNCFKSLFNSAGISKDKNMLDVVRAGAGLYGIGDATDVQPIKSVFGEVLQINRLCAGETAGYNAGFTAKKDVKLAVLDIGYADGFSRILSNKGLAFVHNKYHKIVGNVCMNHCFVLLDKNDNTKVGDSVELLGNHISAKFLAKQMNTIDYEVYCRLNGAKTVFVY